VGVRCDVTNRNTNEGWWDCSLEGRGGGGCVKQGWLGRMGEVERVSI